jgi:RNA-directed DNA polymerase
MEEALGVIHDSHGHLKGSRAVVRYADDAVVFCRGREDAERAREALRRWLTQRGLALSEEKTRIVHITEGFDFLGFTVRQYPARSTRSGYKLLITPSPKSVRRMKARLRDEWLSLRGANVEAVIRRLNPLIRGWAEYFRRQCASEVFRDLDYFMWRRECRYVKRAHPHKSWSWRKQRYWGRFHAQRQDQWVFGCAATGHYLLKFAWCGIKRHALVRGTASPDDPSLKEYWRRRTSLGAQYLPPSKRKIAQRQGYICPGCGESLCNGEEIQVHHLLPRQQGGSDAYQNLTLRHLYCHQQVHRAIHEP